MFGRVRFGNWWTPRFFVWSSVLFLSLIALAAIFILESKTAVMNETTLDLSERAPTLPPFPVGVDPIAKVITEDPAVDSYMNQFVASNHTKPSFGDSWLDRAVTRLANLDWYQNLATPASRVLIIESGNRHEEVVARFGKIMGWNDADKALFLDTLTGTTSVLTDGMMYPGRYVVPVDTAPDAIAIMIRDRFAADVITRYPNDVAMQVPLEQALIIASLIEREAYDFNDMRYISGIIWNRLFSDMRLQLDATLQYAKASKNGPTRDRGWWPIPVPNDKFIASPYNTYQNLGLPPTPIANPSIDAIIAALNPRDTDCFFYYHTNDGAFYCNVAYEEHVAGLKSHFGRGK